MSENLLESRYGIGRHRRRDRVLAVAVATFALVGFLIWAIWFTIADSSKVSFRDVGYQIIDQYSAEVIFEVTRIVGQEVSCDIQVLNQSFAVVGFKALEIPASQSPSQVISSKINTTELGVTGLVDSCR